MAVEQFEQGHLVKLYWQPSTTVGSAFEEIQNISQGDLMRGSSKEATKRTPRGSTIDAYMVSVVRTRPVWAFTLSMVSTDSQYLALSAAYIGTVIHGWMQRGKDSSGADSGGYEICSGALTKFEVKSPLENGEVTVDMEIRPSGAFILDGTLYS